MASMIYQRDEHRVHLVVYHLVWTPKRRKPILKGPIDKDCQAIIEGTSKEQGWEIVERAIQPDHIHLFVRVWPQVPPAQVVKAVKGLTSYRLRQKDAWLKRWPSLWTRSYFCSTAGTVRSATIQRSIESQKGLSP